MRSIRFLIIIVLVAIAMGLLIFFGRGSITPPPLTSPLQLKSIITLAGAPETDVDIAVNETSSRAGMLLRIPGFDKSILHRFIIGDRQSESVALDGTLVKGVDPLYATAPDVLVAATRLAQHQGAFYLWSQGASTTNQITLPGRPVQDVNIVQHPNKWFMLPVQGSRAALTQIDPATNNLVTTGLNGFVKSGVDVVTLSSGDILMPTIHKELLGSFVDRIEPITGNLIASIELQGLLVSDQDLILNGDSALIATASFDWLSGFIEVIDLSNNTSSIICLPGVPIPGVDPILIKKENKVVVGISNRYGLFDRIAIVDLTSLSVELVDAPERIRADVDLVVDGEENFVVAASDTTLVRINLNNQDVDLFPLDGRVITATDMRLLEDGNTLVVPVQALTPLGNASLVSFEIDSGDLKRQPLAGYLTPGVDLLPVNGTGPLLMTTVAHNGTQTLISNFDLDTNNQLAYIIANRDRTNGKTFLSIFLDNNLTDQSLEGLLVTAVDPWHGSALEYLNADEDYIPDDGSCSVDDSNPDGNDNPDRRNGEEDPPVTWIPDDPIVEILINGIGNSIGDLPDSKPDDEGTAEPYDDVIFAGIRDGQGQLKKDTVLVDPFARTVRQGPLMNEARTAHASRTLADGRVLFAGGKSNNNQSLRSAEVFEPKSNQFRVVASMNHARSGAKATRLPGCQGTLVSGGNNGSPQGGPQPEIELFLPGFGWRPAGNMIHPRAYHQTAVAPDGRVWFFGGEDENGPVAEVERFNPDTKTFEVVGSLADPRSHFALVSFYDGRVALVGGRQPIANPQPGGPQWTTVASVELWDIQEGFGTVISQLPFGLSQPVAYRVGENTLHIAGGETEEGASSEVRSVDVLTGETGLVSTTGPTGVRYHSRTRSKPSDEEGTTVTSQPRPPREREPAEYTGGGTTNGGTRPRGTPQPPEEPWDGGDPENDSPGPEDAGDPVSLNTGAFYLRELDYMLSGRGGMNLSLTRTYNSKMSFLGMFGHGWDHIYNERLLRTDMGMELHTGEGAAATYIRNFDGSFTSPAGVYDQLRALPNGTVVIRNNNGDKKFFDQDGRLLRKVDRNGNQLTLEYNPAGRLIRILDPYNRVLNLIYNEQGLIIRTQDFGGRRVIYQYNDSQELIAVTTHAVNNTPNGNDFPFGKTTRYTYACNPTDKELCHNLLTVTRPNEVANGGPPYLVNFYGETKGQYNHDRIVKQIYGGTNHTGLMAGGQITYEYEALTPGAVSDDLNIGRNRTRVTDRNGNVSIYEHNVRGAEVFVANLAGNQRPIDDSATPAPGTDPSQLTVRKEYNRLGQLVKVTHGMGNSIEYTYDENNSDPSQRGNVLRTALIADGRGGKNEITDYTYEPVYNQVLTITDPLGNDPSHQSRVGSWSRDRYVTRYSFDYQEGNDIAALATEKGRSVAEVLQLLQAVGMNLNLGDINGDNRIDRIAGNIIRHKKPAVILSTWSKQRIVEGGDEQPIIITYQHNDTGQVLSEMDPGGNLKRFEYYPSNDPDGDGSNIIAGNPSTLTGYLKATISDAAVTSGRQSARAPRAIRHEMRYDQFGYKISVIDGRGNASRQIRNERGQVVRSIGAAPHFYLVDNYFDANDNLIRIDVQNVRPDDNGIEQIVSDNPFFTTRYDYDILDQLVVLEEETTAPVVPGQPVPAETFRRNESRYDGNGNQIETILPDGSRTVVEHDAFDRIFRITKAAGTAEAGTDTFHYDRNGNEILHVDAKDHGNSDSFGGDPTFTFYDGNDRNIGIVDALGNVVEMVHDAKGHIIERRLYDGQDGRNPDRKFRGHQGKLLAEVHNYYDEDNRLFETEDLLFVPDQSGSTPNALPLRKEYNRLGLIVREYDRDGEMILRAHDGMNTLVREQDEAGNKTEFTHDASNNILTVRTTEQPDPGLGARIIRTSYAVYDNLNRRVRSTNPVGETNYFRHDSRGNLIWQTDSLGVIQNDPMGIVPIPINAPGNAKIVYLDALSRPVRKELVLREQGQGGNPATSLSGNPDGRILETRRYNDRDKLIEITDDPDGSGGGSTTRFNYDNRARLILEIRADGTQVSSQWDADDLRAVTTHANNSVFRYGYDDLGQRTSVNIDRGANIIGTTEQRFRYDGRGQILSTFDNNDPQNSDDDHTLTYRYDSYARAIEDTQDNFNLATEFDNDGQVRSRTHSDGVKIIYTRDRIDRIKQVDRQAAGVSPVEALARFNYKERNSIGQIRFANNTELNNGFDNAGRLDQLSYVGPSPQQPFFDSTYVYDHKSRRAATVYNHRNGVGDVYHYDSASRLTQVLYSVPDPRAEIATAGSGGSPAGSSVFELDGLGNQLKVDNLFAGQSSTDLNIASVMNEYTEVNGETRQYDPDGLPQGDANRRYAFDAFGRLVRVTRPQDNVVLAAYSYDTINRRLTVDYAPVNGLGESLDLVYWGEKVVEEWPANVSNPSILARFSTNFYHQTKDDFDVDGDGNNNEIIDYFVATDILRSAVVATARDGRVLERYRYRVYGLPTILNHDASQTFPFSRLRNRMLFTGYRYEAETGLYDAVSRDYDPVLRRFVQRDPLGLGGGTNNYYEYANSDPINLVDPLGTSAHVIRSALGGLNYLAGTNHPQVSAAAKALADIMVQKKRALYEQYKNDLRVYQRKADQVEDLFFKLMASLANRYNGWVSEENARNRARAGWHFDMEGFKEWWEPLATGLSFIPVLGDIFDAVGLVVGFDLTSLEWLSPVERALMGAGLLIGSGAALVKAAKFAKKALNGADAASDAGRVARNTPTCGATCPPGSTNCFVAGTLVLTKAANASDNSDQADMPSSENSHYKPIEEIKMGDVVLAYDDKTGVMAWKPVVKLYPRKSKIIYLTLQNDKQISLRFGVTQEHPFRSNGEWVAAGKLKPGDTVQTLTGDVLQVESISAVGGEYDVYNFEVKDFHSYFVSKSNVLVHNANYKDRANIEEIFGEGVQGMSPRRMDRINPGIHATESIPARGPGHNWTTAEREWRDRPGAPCHTCGDPLSKKVLDHQPPNAMNPNGDPQVLMRQCAGGCSPGQGWDVRHRP